VTARQLRALRGTAAALVATLIAATAHTLGGGGAPSAGVIAATTVVASPLAVALIGRRPSLWRTATAVVASQLVFHVGFAIFGSLGAAAVRLTPMGAMEGMSGHAMIAPASAMDHTSLIPDAPMLAAHLTAAAVTIALLHRGERMLRAIARGIAHLLPAVEVAVAPAPAAPRPTTAVPESAVVRIPTADLRRRGPPPAFA
jgi:hypothetical protein